MGQLPRTATAKVRASSSFAAFPPDRMERMCTSVLIGLAGWCEGKDVNELPVLLVVEDEYPLQDIVEDALIEGGFAADIVSSGEEAMTAFRGRIKKYKALVTDIALKGGLNGWEVAAQIRESDPGFPVVYMSGAHADEWASKGVPNSVMLTKPFAPAQLITAVSQLLNAVPPAAPTE